MKAILFFILTLLVSQAALSQATTCNNLKITSPQVAKPTDAILVSTTCSTMVVKWQGQANQTYVAQGVFKDAVTLRADTTKATTISIDNSFNCTATIPVIAGKEIGWSVEAQELLNGGVTYTSYALRGALDYPIAPCVTATPLQFSGKVFLQGTYNTSAGNMDNTLNSLGILQANASSQPYNKAPFNYTGTENVGAGFFATHTDIVDWVLLELRNANLSGTIVARRAAFIKQDGTIVETDGSNNQVTFPGVSAGYYYVTVLHRNHLAIRTAAALNFSSGFAANDFTLEPNSAFKNQPYYSPVQTGAVWVMRGGNANSMQNIRYTGPNNDQNQILNIKLGGSIATILNNVYSAEDVNMDGNIKWSGPNNDQNFLLNTALFGSLSTVFSEQL
jgi:hypothetical protein